MGSQINSTRHKKRSWYHSSETIPNNTKRGNPSQIILWDQHHPDTKTWQRLNKKRKLQANIHDEHRCKNLQENTGKLMTIAHQKTYPPRSSRLHPGDARLVQHTQVYKRNPPHKQNQRQKPHNYLNRCREGLWQNSTALYAKNTQ